MGSIGELVATGRTSNVYALGSDSVIKIAHDEVPPEWPEFEARLSAAAHRAGAPTPEVRDLVEVEGRPAIVFERVHGPSMWQQLLDDPTQFDALGHELAAIQRALFALELPAGIPDFVDRLLRRLDNAPHLSPDDRREARDLVGELPRGAALLHGDLHPGNILIGEQGPMVIDWFDAAIGHPLADVIRSSILIRRRDSGAPRHLPGATAELLEALHRAYLEAFGDELDQAGDRVATWQAVIAAARLAEGAEVNHERLLGLWASRDSARPLG